MAGGFESVDEDEAIAQINIIPFVDIVLVLLIIFLLTANLIAKGSIPVDLPQAASANQAVDSTINVVITANGSFFLDGVAVSVDALRSGVVGAFQKDPKVRAVIAADKDVRYDSVVEVVDLVKSVGISAFALSIEPRAR
jgi:biopolymer transport protein ExbD